MLGKEFLKILRNGVMPVIQFTKLCEEQDYDPDENMRCQVISYSNVDNTDNTYSIICDFRGWKEYNKSFARRIWFDKNDNPILTWFESPCYPKNEQYEMFVMLEDNVPFNIVNSSNLYKEYKESGSFLCYIAWLENKVNELRGDN